MSLFEFPFFATLLRHLNKKCILLAWTWESYRRCSNAIDLSLLHGLATVVTLELKIVNHLYSLNSMLSNTVIYSMSDLKSRKISSHWAHAGKLLTSQKLLLRQSVCINKQVVTESEPQISRRISDLHPQNAQINIGRENIRLYPVLCRIKAEMGHKCWDFHHGWSIALLSVICRAKAKACEIIIVKGRLDSYLWV